ncbi:23S rRNA (guanosine(2251)-2'-O)-methyltransferase RlmB [Spirochaeta africana]|uniref:rRNA methylase, putative, group 3 n=1 Tax=Spirochaeta africana (strain ATCC 700263 / DSM 8902 / Z-7692) TaxID=889378 RepID=H9UKG5_SPIAZ|nr:23S rRNA (guanosine(2251)-2'-O)-methyltransferase RlmB [Spirochaeta africana]AFG38008.1 rRNA methylase, putative, group 3 [Spirochaeta africana DSM 8902]
MVLKNLQAVLEALRSGNNGELYVQADRDNQRMQQVVRAAAARGLAVHRVSSEQLRTLAGDDHRGFAFQSAAGLAGQSGASAERLSFEQWLEQNQDTEAVVVFLDGITDPHNLGAVLRSADVFQVDAVVLPARRSAGVTATVVQTSSGAAHYVPLYQVTNLNRAIEAAQQAGFWVYGADMDGDSAADTDLKGRVGLVMGREGAGLHQQTARLCDKIVSIPMRGNVDSLNVSVAAGILLYEIRRQHGWR